MLGGCQEKEAHEAEEERLEEEINDLTDERNSKREAVVGSWRHECGVSRCIVG